MKVNLAKKLAACKKERWILVTYHVFLKYTSFLGVDKKKSIKRIWTISVWQIYKDHYQKFSSGHRIDDRFSYARFEIYIQLFFNANKFLFFFGFNIVYQLLARRLSKKIETMKNYSDMLEPFFAQIRPFSTCTYLALVFCVNKWKSILLKKLAACKKNVDIGYITCISQIYQFSWRRQKKKNQLNASEQFQFGKYIRIITKNFHQVTELMTDFPKQDSFEMYIKTSFNANKFFFFLALILFISYWLVAFQKW